VVRPRVVGYAQNEAGMIPTAAVLGMYIKA
jgi:hypothetical protein